MEGGEKRVPDAGGGFHEVDRGETEFFEGELCEFEELLVVEEGVHHDEERVLRCVVVKAGTHSVLEKLF